MLFEFCRNLNYLKIYFTSIKLYLTHLLSQSESFRMSNLLNPLEMIKMLCQECADGKHQIEPLNDEYELHKLDGMMRLQKELNNNKIFSNNELPAIWFLHITTVSEVLNDPLNTTHRLFKPYITKLLINQLKYDFVLILY